MNYNDEQNPVDLDDEINNATISFVPQIGAGNNKKKQQPTEVQQQPQQQQQLGYGLPSHQQNAAATLGQPPMMMMGFHQPSFHQPPASSFPGPNIAYPAKMSMNNSSNPPYHHSHPHFNQQQQPEIMMGQPVVSSHHPMMNYQPFPTASSSSSPSGLMMYPTAGQYHQHQPSGGAMVLLVQESMDLDFRAPLCSMNSFTQCINAFFLPYCLLARQQNMISKGPVDAFRVGPASIPGMPSRMDEQKVQDARMRNTDYNGCCLAALAFDVGRVVAAAFVPQIAGTLWVVNGLCLQTLQTRQSIRARFGIAPSQCSDMLVSVCCQCCATMQHQEEMRLRNFDAGLTCAQDNRPLPVSNNRMY